MRERNGVVRRGGPVGVVLLALWACLGCAASEPHPASMPAGTCADPSTLEQRVRACLSSGEFDAAIGLTAFLPPEVAPDERATEVRAELLRLLRLRREAILLREFAKLENGVRGEARMEPSIQPPFESRPRT